MTLEATTDLLIGQWQDSDRLKAAIQAPIDAGQEAADAFDALAPMRHIDTAQGVWLDFLGARVGLERPSIAQTGADTRFGFEGPDQAVGFDQAPFRGLPANDAVFALQDHLYRAMIRARAVLVIGDGTCQTFAKAVHFIDPSAAITDNRDMTIDVVTSERALLELADTAGALPRTAGVQINFLDREVFGFDDAGRGFDLAPFRGGRG